MLLLVRQSVSRSRRMTFSGDSSMLYIYFPLNRHLQNVLLMLTWSTQCYSPSTIFEPHRQTQTSLTSVSNDGKMTSAILYSSLHIDLAVYSQVSINHILLVTLSKRTIFLTSFLAWHALMCQCRVEDVNDDDSERPSPSHSM